MFLEQCLKKLFLCPQNRLKHNQHFKMLLFRINVLFGTTGLMLAYEKLHLLINSVYLLFLSIEIQQDSYWPNYTTSCFHSEKNVSQPSKKVTAKNSSPSGYVISKACFDECFLFHFITWRHYFLYKFIVSERFLQQPCLAFFETSVWRDVYILCQISPQ